MNSEKMELSTEEMAEVVGARSNTCFVVAISCAATISAPEFELAIVAVMV